MNFYKYALSAVALAVSQMATAQAPTAPAGAARKDAQSATNSSVAAPTSAAVGAVNAGQSGDQADAAVNAPRVIRGNDRVIAPAKAAPRFDGKPVSFNFEEAPVAQVVRTILGDILKVDYVLHPPLTGTVTLATRAPVSPDNAAFLLESALQANGLVLVRDVRGTYHVGRPDVLKGVVGTVRQGGIGALPPGSGVIVIPLQFIGAGEMATILRPMMQPESLLQVDSVRNLLVLSGTRTQAEGWLDVVSTFDVDLLKGMSVGVFALKHASVKEVEAALALVSGGGGAPAAASVARGSVTATGGTAQASLGEANPLFGAVRIMPIERLNSILVVTPRASYLEEARRWIDKLDQPSDNGAEPQLFIYRVQNGNARHLAGVLGGIFGGGSAVSNSAANSGVAPSLAAATGSTFTGGGGALGGGAGLGGGAARSSSSYGGFNAFGGAGGAQSRQGQGGVTAAGAAVGGAPAATNIGGVRVMADELNNSILVWSTKAEFQKIESTLKRLDLPPTQVLIEASIIEVTLNDDLNYGLQWAFGGGVGGGFQGVGQLGAGGVKPSTGSLTDAIGKGFSYSLVNSAGQIRVALSALANKTQVKMISNPSLMVLDNHLAMMAVGNQVPVQTSTTDYINNSNAVTSTIQYRDTGVNLAVTPSVNAGNLVTMQIDQTVTDTAESGGATANSQPIFLQRQISSKVAVRSGESIVLGGLIKDSQSAGKSGMPLLQDLPLLGNLFGTNTRGGTRTELLVVITPKVVRADPEIREVSEELRDRLKGLEIIEMRQQGRSNAAPVDGAAQVQPLPQR